MRRRLAALLCALLIPIASVAGGALNASPAGAAVGGPIILGGDDLTDHGSVDSSGTLFEGWLYIQKALENIRPRVTKPNNGRVAAIGSAPSTATSGDAGAAIGNAAAKAGMPVDYFDTPAEMQALFDGLKNNTLQPMILWISGDGAGNDLGDDSNKVTTLTNNAKVIADFVNVGGGLLSHGSEYGWLSALLPGSTTPDTGGGSDLELTSEGSSAFPGLTNDDVNAGPWHNHFEGNIGNLQVLVRSTTVTTSSGAPAPVIIGGAQVTLPGATVPYVMVAADGGVFAPGGSGFVGTAALRNGDPIDRNPDGTIKAPSLSRLVAPVMAIAYTADRRGAWLVQSNGDVREIGNAPNIGDLLNVRLEAPIVAAAASKDGAGLYLVGEDGGVFALNAPFLGSLPSLRLKPEAPIVGITIDPDGTGYILAGADGGVFAFQAPYVGNARGLSKHRVSGITADPDGTGYLLSALDGGVFALGAKFSGSAVGLPLEGPIIGIAANPNGKGYWLAGLEGGVFAFGGAPFMGSVAHIVLNAPIVGIVAL